MYTLAILFTLFIIFSFIGYLVEIVVVAVETENFTLSRGFLIGPIIPVFGVGGMLMYLLLYKYQNDPLALFTTSLLMCTALEYFTSYIMEKIFKLRWWDYSDKKMNLNGRVCLTNALGFGIGGVIMVNIVNSKILTFLYSLPENLIYVIASVLAVLFLTDLIISANIIFKLRGHVTSLIRKDSTAKVKKEVRQELSKHSVLTKRLVRAFPDLSKLNKSFRTEKIEKLIFGTRRFLFFKKK